MKNGDTLAVLADIHGNAPALEAVLTHAQKNNITRFVNLGDTFYGPLDPKATWEILRSMDIPTILGNQDRILLENGAEWEQVPAHQKALNALGEPGMAWLRTLPAMLTMDDILLTHGTPKSDMDYLLEDVTTGQPVMRQCDAIMEDLLPEASGCSLVLAGHSHFPGRIDCGSVTVINPGSVGLPAYDDDTPPHAMASGSPHARYAVVTRTHNGWDVDFLTIEYDWHQTAAMAEANGRNDWAKWLKTGVA